jgi:hypothetical protein
LIVTKVENGAVQQVVERVDVIDQAQAELVCRVEELKSSHELLAAEWPTPREGWATVSYKRKNRNVGLLDTVYNVGSSRAAGGSTGSVAGLPIDGVGGAPEGSFAKQCESLSAGSVTVVGDSMVRGVGQKLRRDNEMFSTFAYGGAKIEDITEKLNGARCKIGEESHLVVMVGTNNLRNDGTEVIMAKYSKLVTAMKEAKCRARSIIGILARGDTDDYLEGKRTALNIRLGALCKKYEVEFIDPFDIYDEINGGSPLEIRRIQLGVLDKWGLHLNDRGQDKVARSVFKHCVKHLN